MVSRGSLGFAIPTELLLGPVHRAAWIAAAGLVAMLALAIGLALWLSRRLSHPIAQLAASAESLGRREVAVATGTRIREIAELESALNAASSGILTRDRELRRQASELQAADANKSRFLALLSHELRNPLAPLLNGLAILKSRHDPDTIARTQAMMERQIGQMRRLIDDLLDVSRIDQGKLDLRVENVAVDSVIRNAIETSKPNIELRQHALAVQYASQPLYVEADVVRLGQVLANLLNNAAKFTPPNGRIEIETRADGADAVLCVRDSGIGFLPEDADRIFESFVQLETGRGEAAGGLGLGLTLVRSLIRLHGGTIDARSRGVGQGAEFVIRLPLARPKNDATSPAVVRNAARSSRRILVVDDNTDAADTLADLLRIEGYVVRIAYAGDLALSVAREFRPDVAFVDLNMPGMSGLALARALRADPEMTGIQLISLTGMGQKHDLEATHAAGFDHHLIKPAAAEDLLRLAAHAATGTVTPIRREDAA